MRKYYYILAPVNFTDLTADEFKAWCKKLSLKSLKEELERFAEAEMYELCVIIRDEIILKRVNNILNKVTDFSTKETFSWWDYLIK